MSEITYPKPMNIILEGYQPIHTGNVDPKRPPRGRSAVVPRPTETASDRQAPSSKSDTSKS